MKKKKYKQITDKTGNLLSALIFPMIYLGFGLYSDGDANKFVMSELGSLTIVLMVIIGYQTREQDDMLKFLQKRYEREQDVEEKLLNKVKGDE